MKNTKTSYLTIVVTALCVSLPYSNAAVIADVAADYLTAPGGSATSAPTEAPAGWAYLISTAAIGGTEEAMDVNVTSGNAGNNGFAGGNNSFIQGSLTNATVGAEYEIFTDGYNGSGTGASSSATGNEGIVGTDLLISPGSTAADGFVIARYTISAADILNGTTATIAGSFRNLVVRNTSNTASQGSVDVFVYHNAALLFGVDQVNEAATASMLSQSLGTFNITNLTVAENDTISFVVGYNDNNARDETALQAQISLIPEPSAALLGGLGLLGLLRRRRQQS